MECEIYLWLMPHKVQVITENQRNRLESCECVACSDFNKSHQPAESGRLQQEKQTAGKFRFPGTRNTHG